MEEIKRTEETVQESAQAEPQVEAQAPAAKDPDTFIRFKKPYRFEGIDHVGVDLNGMEKLTAKDMIEAEKYLARTGVISPIPEMTVEYVSFIANRISDQPLEFFKNLPPREVIKIKNKITGFFYGED